MSYTKSYKLQKVDIVFDDGEKADIIDMVGEFNWMESIDSPFIRCDIAILDSVNFDDNLRGSEEIQIQFETSAAGRVNQGKFKTIKHTLRVYQIGSVVKQERTKMYILHCASPEIYANESNRAFGAFGPMAGRTDIVERMLLKKLNVPKDKVNIEPYSNANCVSPNWRPVDLISYISDKVARTKGGNNKKRKASKGDKKAGKRQSGFLFYENKNGFNFLSMDYLCEQKPLCEYVYGQSNVNDNNPAVDAYKIESVQYPERTNQLEKLRLGVYKTVTYGISFPQITDSFAPQAGGSSSLAFDKYFQNNNNQFQAFDSNTKLNQLTSSQLADLYAKEEKQENRFFTAGNAQSFKWDKGKEGSKKNLTDQQVATQEKMGKPGGTAGGPYITNIFSLFETASTVEKGFPYDKELVEKYTERAPTRSKFKILPKNAHQTAGADDGGATDQSDNTVICSAYSAARWSLLNTHTLTISVPGNTSLYAGAIIKVDLPSSNQKGNRKVQKDRIYSGKYVIKGLIHTYKKTGITTQLFLCRDSLPVSKNK